MTCIAFACEKCAHYRGMDEEFVTKCDAFPERIQFNLAKEDPTKYPECNNGIKFEPK